MEENLGFTGLMAQSLEKQKKVLDSSVMPKMKELFHIFHSSYVGLYNVLLKKGLIHEDPYKYDQKISEVSTPPDGSFLEGEKSDQLSIRLSQFESTLDFLTNYYQFSLDFVTLSRVRQLLAFIKYINWDAITTTSPSINTRVLAEFLDKIRKGTDTLSASIIGDAQNHLEQTSKQIINILKTITVYHREKYKLEVRERVLTRTQIDPATAMAQRHDLLRAIKRSFALEMGDTPFYPELVEEIIEEDYSPNAEALRTELLKKLEIREERKQKVKEEISFKQVLLEAIRALASAGYQLEEIIRKLNDDNDLLKHQKTAFLERLRNWLVKALRGEDPAQIYQLEYFDIITSSTKAELVDFPRFIEEVTQKAKLFSVIGLRTSPSYRKLEGAPEEQVYSFLNRNLEDTQLIFRRLTALDTYFKSEVSRDDRVRLRGIKLELSAVKNSIMKANQKKHEYVARREELEQMKKLGISPTPPG